MFEQSSTFNPNKAKSVSANLNYKSPNAGTASNRTVTPVTPAATSTTPSGTVKVLETVKDEYTVKVGDCDALHAFQSRQEPDPRDPTRTISVEIGGMNRKVKEKIDKWVSLGYKVKPTAVRVEVMDTTVKWEVDISESDDGNNWVGFTSRGAGCNNNVKTRYNSASAGQDPDSIIRNIEKPENKIGKVDKFELITVFEHKDPKKSSNNFIQAFYRYSLKSKY